MNAYFLSLFLVIGGLFPVADFYASPAAQPESLEAAITDARKFLEQHSPASNLDARARRMGSNSFYGHRLREAAIYGDEKSAREALTAAPDLVQTVATQSLLIASERGHLGVVKVLLEWKTDVRTRGDGLSSGGSKATPLHLAAAGGHVEVATALIEAGAVIDDNQQFSGNTALLMLVKQWAGFTPSQFHSDEQKTALEDARATASLLLEHGANIFSTNREYRPTSPLSFVIANRRLDWADLLLSSCRVQPSAFKQPDSLLHVASRLALTNAVSVLIKRGWPLNRPNGEGFTPLQVAIQAKHIIGQTYDDKTVECQDKTCRLLLDAGATLDVFSAAGLGNDDILLQREPAILISRDALGCTPLHWAASNGQTNAVAILYKRGIDLRAVDQRGRLALHEACAFGHSNVVSFFLTNQVSPTVPDKVGRTALHEAAEAGCSNIVAQLLKAGANADSKDKAGNTPLDLAAKKNHSDIVRQLLAAGAKINEGGQGLQTTPLHSEVTAGNRDVTKELLRKNAAPNALDENGRRPIHMAVANKDIAMLELLLKYDADINGRDTNGDTVLHYCLPGYRDTFLVPAPPTWRQQVIETLGLQNIVPLPAPRPAATISFVEYLLRQGANPNATNLLGRTPLHRLGAEQQFTGLDEIDDDSPFRMEEANVVAALVKHGAKINAPDREGLTPLHLVANGGSMNAADLLLRNGADPNIRSKDGRVPLHFAATHLDWVHDGSGWGTKPENMVMLLLARGANVNAQANDGRTPLHVMVTQEHGFKLQWIPLLLKAGAQVNLADKDGRTALHTVLTAGWPWAEAKEVTQLLIDNGADPNARDKNGQTPLHYLAKINDLFFVKGLPQVLLNAKGDVNIVDKEGLTPLQVAARANNGDLVRIFNEQSRTNKPSVVALRSASSHRPEHRDGFEEVLARGDLEMVQSYIESAPELLNQPVRSGGLPLQTAYFSGNKEVCEYLLKKGAKIDAFSAVLLGREKELVTALDASPTIGRASLRGLSLAYYAAHSGNESCLRILLDRGVDPNVGSELHSPLFAALAEHHTNCANLLRKKGGQLNVFDAVGFNDTVTLQTLLTSKKDLAVQPGPRLETPLHEAARSNGVAAAELLLSHGANPNARNSKGWTPLHISAAYGFSEMVGLLIRYKADVNLQQNFAPTPIPGLPHETLTQPSFNTALHLAAQTGQTNVVRLLLENGAEPNLTNVFSRTPLFVSRHLPVSPKHASYLFFLLPGSRHLNGLARPTGTSVALNDGEIRAPLEQTPDPAVRKAIESLLLTHGAIDFDSAGRP